MRLFTRPSASPRYFRLSVGCLQLDLCLCQLPIGVLLDKFGIRRVGLHQHVPVERCVLWAALHRHRRIFCGAVSARSRRGANLSCKCQGDRPLVSFSRAQFCHFGFRRRRQVRFCNWAFRSRCHYCSRSDGDGAFAATGSLAFYIFLFSGESIAIRRTTRN